MGAAFVQPQFPNVVGGFGYNTCYDKTVCNAICCCGLSRWYGKCCLGSCTGDARMFTDPAWLPGTVLRSEFEQRLRSQELLDVIRSSPTSCCGFEGLASPAGEIDRVWCTKVNQELLHPAGYSCKAHSWITYNEKGQKQEHMQMVIQRNALMPGQISQSNTVLQVTIPDDVMPGQQMSVHQSRDCNSMT